MNFQGVAAVFLSGGLFLLVGGMPLHPVFQMTWHDQQRIGQILVFLIVALSWFVCFPVFRRVSISKWAFLAMLGIVGLGGLSAMQSMRPEWAFAEIALFLSSTGLAFTIAFGLRNLGTNGDGLMSGFVRFLLLVVALQFYVASFSALMHADLYFHPWNLLDGFSNIRHQGQFLTMMLPLLGACWPVAEVYRRRYPKWLDFSLMTTIAAMVFVGGTRGSVAAWLLGAFVFAWIPGGARQLALRVLLALACGYLLAMSLLQLIARVSGQATLFRFSGAQVFGLSAREQLWQRSFELIAEHPWLGIGPMQFTGEKLAYGAHPHQATLQIAAEWGVPILVLVLCGIGYWLSRAVLRAMSLNEAEGSSLRWGLLFSLLAALVQAQVDGVLVMPYPQLWLAIIVGWAMATFHQPRASIISCGLQIPAWMIGLLLILPSIYLASIAIRDFSSLQQAPEHCASGPRFWCNGGIDY